jgi:integrase
MASYRKLPSGKWYAEIKLLGVRESQGGFNTKGHATAWAVPREAEIRAANGKGKPIEKTLADALDKYGEEVSPTKKGKDWELIRLKKFKREIDFVGKFMADIDETDIAGWRNYSLNDRKPKLAPSSVNREMNLLSNVFTVAVREWKWCKHNPVRETKRPKNPKHRDRLTTDNERKIMLDALGYVEGQAPVTISQRVAYAYLLARETAMRESEMCSLNKKTIHLKKQYVHLPDTKNNDARDVALSKRAVYLLGFFPEGLGITPSQIDSHWRKARNKTDVENLRFHDSCHQAITDLARKVNVLELSRMTGRTIKTLMIYYNETATAIAAKLG